MQFEVMFTKIGTPRHKHEFLNFNTLEAAIKFLSKQECGTVFVKTNDCLEIAHFWYDKTYTDKTGSHSGTYQSMESILDKTAFLDDDQF